VDSATYTLNRQTVQPIQQLTSNIFRRLVRLHPRQPPYPLYRHLRQHRQLLQQRFARLQQDEPDHVLRDENVAL
jgi:hypothetical protein